MTRGENGNRKKGLKAGERRTRRGVVKGACEPGSGDGNSSHVFTMSSETYEFLGQCVRKHMVKSRPKQADSLLVPGFTTCKHGKLRK